MLAKEYFCRDGTLVSKEPKRLLRNLQTGSGF
jgi:hypothetical protein